MKTIANFVFLTMVYQTQCQIHTVHNYVSKITEGTALDLKLSKVPQVDSHLENPIFTLQSDQENFMAVFQPEKSTVAPQEYAPSHPPSYQVAFGPPAFLDQRPTAARTSRNIHTGSKVTTIKTLTEEKYLDNFEYVGTVASLKSKPKRKLQKRRDLQSVLSEKIVDPSLQVDADSEVPQLPVLHFAVLPLISIKENFHVLSHTLSGDALPKATDSSPRISTVLPLPESVGLNSVIAAVETPISEDNLPPQLSSLLPRVEKPTTLWNA